MENKFLDIDGVTHLYKKLSLEDYPNNETLQAVINAIDQTKVDAGDVDDIVSIKIQTAIANGDLKGEKGDTGAQGLTGAIGPQGPKGDKGDKGDTGPAGDGFVILGTYSTLSQLTSEHPTGSVGDMYLVTQTLYTWNDSASGWVSIGKIDSNIVDLSNIVYDDELAAGSKPISLLNSYTTIRDEQNGNVDKIAYNNVAWLNNKYILGTSEGDNSKYCCTKTYIPVVPDVPLYLFCQGGIKTYFLHYYFYNSDQEQVGYGAGADHAITPPSDAAYVRFSYLKSNYTDMEMDDDGNWVSGSLEMYQQSTSDYNPGSFVHYETFNKAGFEIEPSVLQDNSIPLEKCTFTTVTDAINLCDTTKIVSGYNGGSNWNVVNSNDLYCCTELIAVKPNDILSFWKLSSAKSNTAKKVAVRFVSAYDSAYNVISSALATYVTEYTVPWNVYYIRVTFIMQYIDNDFDLCYIQRHVNTEAFQEYYEPNKGITLIDPQYINEQEITLHTALPPEICVPNGQTIELYNSQVCLEADKYHLQWTGSYGADYGWKYVLTGATDLIGKSFTLVLQIRDDDLTLLETCTTTVKFVGSVVSTNQLIVPIGDSLTNQKPWLSRIYNNLSGQKIAFRGTRGTTDPSLVNGITHEGRSGATPDWYNKGTSSYVFDTRYLSTVSDGTVNPFWNPNTNSFDFDYYCNSAANGGAGYFQDASGNAISIEPTGVMIYLGTNGIQEDPTDAVNNIYSLIYNIRNSSKGLTLPIYVVNTLFRAPVILSTSSDGFATNSTGEYKYLNDIKHMNLMKALNEKLKNATRVYIVPIATTHDSEHNFPFVEEGINPYNTSITTRRVTDTVHPAECGYNQMAATMFGSIIAHHND